MNYINQHEREDHVRIKSHLQIEAIPKAKFKNQNSIHVTVIYSPLHLACESDITTNQPTTPLQSRVPNSTRRMWRKTKIRVAEFSKGSSRFRPASCTELQDLNPQTQIKVILHLSLKMKIASETSRKILNSPDSHNHPPLSMSNHHSHLNQGARKPRPRNDLRSRIAPNRHAAKIPLMYSVSPNSSATQARSPTAQNILRSFQLGDPSPSFALKSRFQSCGNESHMAKTGIPKSGRSAGGKEEASFAGGQSISSLDVNSRHRDDRRSSRFLFRLLSRAWGRGTRNLCSWGIGAISCSTFSRGHIGRCTPVSVARLELCRIWR